MTILERNRLARELVGAGRAAIARLEGSHLVEHALAGSEAPTLIIGAGKAVGAMAAGAQRALGPAASFGVLIGKHAGPPEFATEVRLAAHPIPDQRGEQATRELVAQLSHLGDDDHVLFLLSGGASALLGAPVDGITLDEMQRATRRLLASGAAIAEVNTVRRHAGRALGGRLAAATRARIETLALSDVVGNDTAAIGSGPTAPDPTTFADALAVARRYHLGGALEAYFARGGRGEEPDTPKPGDLCFTRADYHILATPTCLRTVARDMLERIGLRVNEAAALVEGDIVKLAADYAERALRLPPASAWVAVGEPTVELGDAEGQGGRSQQLALLLAELLRGSDLAFLALGSDGSDGPTDAAGAVVDGHTWEEALTAKLDPREHARRCDAYPLLDRLGSLVRTGATGTNLLDLHVIARPPDHRRPASSSR